MGVPEYKAKASAKVYTRYHIVLVTKYRRPALAGIERDALDSIRQVEQHSRFTVHEANTGDGNHIHLLVSIPPDQTISGTVQRIKQLTAHGLWTRHENHLKRFYWGKHRRLWSAGYYCTTVGETNEQTIRNYIHNQTTGGSSARLKVTRLSGQQHKGKDDRLTDLAVSGGIRVSKTVPLPSDRLIPREHWVGVAVQCWYTLHVDFENGRIVVTDVEMDDMVMLVQKPRRPLTGKPDYGSDGEMMSAVFTAGLKRENTTRNWLDDDSIDMCRRIAERHKPKVTGSLTIEDIGRQTDDSIGKETI